MTRHPLTADVRFVRLIGHLHGLGARATSEFISEVVTAHGLEDDILRRLEQYGRLSPAILAALGGDQLIPAPLMVIAGGRLS